jgi:hypothetical protein
MAFNPKCMAAVNQKIEGLTGTHYLIQINPLKTECVLAANSVLCPHISHISLLKSFSYNRFMETRKFNNMIIFNS